MRGRALHELARCELPRSSTACTGRRLRSLEHVDTIYSARAGAAPVCREHPTLVSERRPASPRRTPRARCRAPRGRRLSRRSGGHLLRAAAERLGLRPIRYPFQDREDNLTEFVLVRLACAEPSGSPHAPRRPYNSRHPQRSPACTKSPQCAECRLRTIHLRRFRFFRSRVR